VDLDGDGHVDLLSGSWPGELHFFRGGPGRTFAAPEVLKDKDGRIINPGGGIKKLPNGAIEVVGDAKWEESEDSPSGWVVIYQDQRIMPEKDQEMWSTGNASAVHAADWNGDGKLDLLVGNFDGHVYFIPNEARDRGYSFGKEQRLTIAGEPLRVDHDAGPFAADWDGDGDLDLLVGDGEGAVSLFRNIGSAKEPKLAKAEQLIAPGSAEYGPNAPNKPTRGIRSKVCVTDWNGDGRLDLLVGDMAYLKPPAKELSDEEQAKHAAIREQIKPLQKQRSELLKKRSDLKTSSDKADRKSLAAKLRDLNDELEKLESQLPAEIEDHGWVWLFLRKPEIGHTKPPTKEGSKP
jgi:hypothetical protein